MLSLYTILQVTVSKDDTIILDGAGDKAIIEERLEQVSNDSTEFGS